MSNRETMHTNECWFEKQHILFDKGILDSTQHYLLINYNGIPVVSHIIFTLKPNELIVINVTAMNAKGTANDYPLPIVKCCC